MSIHGQLKEASQKYAFLLRLVQEARLSPDRDRAILLYSMARTELDNLIRTLKVAVDAKRPATRPARREAA
jgi:hypothetical protein